MASKITPSLQIRPRAADPVEFRQHFRIRCGRLWIPRRVNLEAGFFPFGPNPTMQPTAQQPSQVPPVRRLDNQPRPGNALNADTVVKSRPEQDRSIDSEVLATDNYGHLITQGTEPRHFILASIAPVVDVNRFLPSARAT